MALVLLIAFGLKAHYSAAPVDRLDWIMRPTAGLVQLCAGLPFEREAGTGYANREHRVVIAKPCAGVNFLIMAFCMLSFTLIGRAGAGRRPYPTVAVALAAAYAATVIVNSVRIMIALRHAGDSPGSDGWLTPGQLHRLEGIVVYFAALTGLYCLARLIERAGSTTSPATCAPRDQRRSGAASFPERRSEPRCARWSLVLVPLGWYAAMTLGVPLLNGGGRGQQPLLAEHALWVLGVPLSLIGVSLLISRFRHSLRRVRRPARSSALPGVGVLDERCR